jgi:hypothetical protein
MGCLLNSPASLGVRSPLATAAMIAARLADAFFLRPAERIATLPGLEWSPDLLFLRCIFSALTSTLSRAIFLPRRSKMLLLAVAIRFFRP